MLAVGTNALRTQASRGLTNNDNLSVSFYMALPFTPSFVDLRRSGGSFPNKGAIFKNPGLANSLEQIARGGRDAYYAAEDGWALHTVDGSRAAHVEHTVAVTEDGPRVLTAPRRPAAPRPS